MAVLAVVLGASLSGCSLWRPGPAPIDDAITVLARLEGWEQRLSTDQTVPADLIVELAYDQSTARVAWDESAPDRLPERSGEPRQEGRYGSLDDLDLDRQALVVYSSGQSGSCPGWPVDLSLDGRVLVVEETEYVEGDGCNESFSPYRVLLAVDRDVLPAADDLPLDTARTGDREFDALVTTYPAGN